MICSLVFRSQSRRPGALDTYLCSWFLLKGFVRYSFVASVFLGMELL